MLLRHRVTLTFSFLAILLLILADESQSQTCVPRCSPTELKAKKDCLVFQYIPTCRHSRFQPFLKGPECACMWKAFLRTIAPFQSFQKYGLECLTWALKNCASDVSEDESKNNIDRHLIPKLLGNLKDLTVEDKEKQVVEIPDLLKELDKDVQTLEDSVPDARDSSTIAKEETMTEVYGVLNKDEEKTLRAVEKMADEENANVRIGWMWTVEHDKFALAIFFLVILFVLVFMVTALLCMADSVFNKKEKKGKLEKGDLDPDLYKNSFRMTRRLTGFSGSGGGMAGKNRNIQQFLDKLRVSKSKNPFEDMHQRMRGSTYPEKRPSQPSPVQMFKGKMVRVEAQTPIYDHVNEQNLSEDEETTYHRTKGPVFSMNDTYEQPLQGPLYENQPGRRDQSYNNGKHKERSFYKTINKSIDETNIDHVPQLIETYEEISRKGNSSDPVYANEHMSASRNYQNLSPDRDMGQESPNRSPSPRQGQDRPRRGEGSHTRTMRSPPLGLNVEISPGALSMGQRILVPMKKKKQKGGKPKFMMLPVMSARN